MGSYSEVYMAVRGPREVMLAEFVKLELTADHVMTACLKEWIVQEVNADVDNNPQVLATLHGQDWKWYDGFEEVQAHKKIFRTFNELSDAYETENLNDGLHDKWAKVCGVYLRIGGEDYDNATEYFGDEGCELANISRSIRMEYARDGNDEIRPGHKGDEAQRQADAQAARETFDKVFAEHRAKNEAKAEAKARDGAAHPDPQLVVQPPG